MHVWNSRGIYTGFCGTWLLLLLLLNVYWLFIHIPWCIPYVSLSYINIGCLETSSIHHVFEDIKSETWIFSTSIQKCGFPLRWMLFLFLVVVFWFFMWFFVVVFWHWIFFCLRLSQCFFPFSKLKTVEPAHFDCGYSWVFI